MQDYKPNSHRFKEEQKNTPSATEEKKFDKVVTGAVKTRKKSGVLRFMDVFISDDIHNVKDYFVNEVVVPMLKKGLMGALDMMLNGGSIGYADRQSSSKVTYGRYYDDPRDSRRSYERDQPRPRFDRDEIVFATRRDAEAVLRDMLDAVKEYKIVSVADMYDMADLPQPHTSHSYGWTNLDSADIARYQDGWIIKLPKAVPID